jgi:hypothetical protein
MRVENLHQGAVFWRFPKTRLAEIAFGAVSLHVISALAFWTPFW